MKYLFAKKSGWTSGLSKFETPLYSFPLGHDVCQFVCEIVHAFHIELKSFLKEHSYIHARFTKYSLDFHAFFVWVFQKYIMHENKNTLTQTISLHFSTLSKVSGIVFHFSWPSGSPINLSKFWLCKKTKTHKNGNKLHSFPFILCRKTKNKNWV